MPDEPIEGEVDRSSPPFLSSDRNSPDTYVQTIPLRYRGVYLRAVSGSLSAACKAMCLQCMGWEEGAAKAIRHCTDLACPLWRKRPYQVKTESGEKDTRSTADGKRLEALKRAREAREAKKGKEGG